MSSKSTPIYTLRIELQDVEPLVWRRVQVPANITLPKLHRVIQAAMGWTNSHLHSFRVGEHEYAQPDELEELDFIDEKGVKLDSLIGDSIDAFSYQYDFGDSWHHQIIVESKGKGKPGWSYPLCIGGQRACPQRMSVVRPGIKNSPKPCAIPTMQNMKATSPGLADSSTPRDSMAMPSMIAYANGNSDARTRIR